MTTDTGREPTRRDLIQGWGRPIEWLPASVFDDAEEDAQAARREQIYRRFGDWQRRQNLTREEWPEARVARQNGYMIEIRGRGVNEWIEADWFISQEDVR